MTVYYSSDIRQLIDDRRQRNHSPKVRRDRSLSEEKMDNFGGCAQGKNRPLSAPLERVLVWCYSEYVGKTGIFRQGLVPTGFTMYFVRQNTFYGDYCKYGRVYS